MKATGIVRRIDDLGRVVIPKEIRRTMRIREGDPLEIFTDRDGEVIFKKYSPIGELTGFAAQYADTLFKTAGSPIVICDRDAVIAYAGLPKKECADRKISPDIESIMESRKLYCHVPEDAKKGILDGAETPAVSCAMPILSGGDIIGCVSTVLNEEAPTAPTDVEIKLIQTAAVFLGKQLDE